MTATETGAILLDRRTVTALRTVLRDWTNTTHAAVVFELEVMSRGLGSGRAGLEELDARIAARREQWSAREAPEPMLLVNRLALRAAAEHLAACRAGSGRFRAMDGQALAELLPRCTAKAEYFRVPDAHGDVPAGLTLDGSELQWYAESTANAHASAARQAPLARLAFGVLRRSSFPPGTGGSIVGADGAVVESFG